ncbi:uncharacterized protein LOC111052364 isoform X2 [Nilaparvata lugens]|uniref:uncharacterized protein LOC111052364 isoform X2 n=1 Tax=Nilaparvata lugens TaxID=108931 RepID=UPI00193DBEA7|nr:uncharacterized protein LOC111052364 isoform X2 [Nilaparvata lugens]
MVMMISIAGAFLTNAYNLRQLSTSSRYSDDIRKAREKLRKAESDSEVLTEFDEGGKEKRKRRPVKKILSSSDSEDEAPVTKQIKYPEPPSELLVDVEAQHILTTNGLDVLAGHLARINRRLDDIEKNQSEILARLCPTKPAMNIIPPDIKLPCETLDKISDLKDWLLDDTNKQSLITILSLLGGKKVGRVVRNILEKIFTNDVAELFNWTGRHSKRCLRDLAVMKLIPGAVRKQKNLSSATDDEINTNIANWFRFSKDRNGGREQRRKDKPRQDHQDQQRQ